MGKRASRLPKRPVIFVRQEQYGKIIEPVLLYFTPEQLKTYL